LIVSLCRTVAYGNSAIEDALLRLLREKGHDACTARQQKLNGRSDLDLGAACRNEQRAIITLLMTHIAKALPSSVSQIPNSELREIQYLQ
jgi:hypothetical protein